MHIKNLNMNFSVPYVQELEQEIYSGRFPCTYSQDKIKTGRSRNSLSKINYPGSPHPLLLKVFGETDKASSSRRFEIKVSSFFKNMARQSYEGAQSLLEAGINTPRPVAYWSEYRGPWSRYDLYVYEYFPSHNTLQKIRRSIDPEPSLEDQVYFNQLVSRMAWMTRKIHDAGLRHGDFATHNFLVLDDMSLVILDTDHIKKTRTRGMLKYFLDMHCMKRLGFDCEGQRFFLREYLGRRPTSLEWLIFRFWTKGGFRMRRWLKRSRKTGSDAVQPVLPENMPQMNESARH